MGKLITVLLICLTLPSCSDQPQTKNKGEIADTSQSAIIASKPKKKASLQEQTSTVLPKEDKIDYTLDNLLSFDSEKALKKVYGEHVIRSTGYYPEGMGEYSNTLLYPNSKNEVEFVWENDSLQHTLQYIKLSGKDTDWKTTEGITIGTKLKELESFNGKSFTFLGLEWDFGGSINWENGQLQHRKIFGWLAFPENEIPDEFEGLRGDHEIESSSELAQKSPLVLSEILMRRTD